MEIAILNLVFFRLIILFFPIYRFCEDLAKGASSISPVRTHTQDSPFREGRGWKPFDGELEADAQLLS